MVVGAGVDSVVDGIEALEIAKFEFSWNYWQRRSRIIGQLEAAALAIERGIPVWCREAHPGTFEIVLARTTRIAAALRELELWAVTPLHTRARN